MQIRLFTCDQEMREWEARNCKSCQKSSWNMLPHETQCDIERVFDGLFMRGDGKVNEETAIRMGYTNGVFDQTGSCPQKINTTKGYQERIGTVYECEKCNTVVNDGDENCYICSNRFTWDSSISNNQLETQQYITELELLIKQLSAELETATDRILYSTYDDENLDKIVAMIDHAEEILRKGAK